MMKQVKTLFMASVMFFSMNQVINAQQKTAHIDLRNLMTNMPEMKTAQTQLEKISKTYDSEYRTMVEEYQNKIRQYEQEATTVTDKVNEDRSKEVETLAQNITQYRNTAARELEQKQMDIMKPIMEKARQAIQKVAKAKGYQYVLDSSEGSGVLLADGPDILVEVKKELGF